MLKRVKKLFSKLGPGFITGASDDDPSGIGTYSAAGAKFGFGQLWTPLFTFPLMTAVQEMCARIGLVTGRGLAGVMRQQYAPWLLYSCTILLVIANTINIGADIGAMAAAVGLLITAAPFAFIAGALTVAIVVLEVFIPYHIYSKILRVFAFSLFAYWITGFIIEIDWSIVAQAIMVPQWQWSSEYIIIFVGVLGTTISPYLFFWQASEEVEEEIAAGHTSLESRRGATKAEIHAMRQDNFIGMLFSNISMFFIILVSGATLHVHGILNIETAEQAAQALAPLAGTNAFLLFTLGIIGVGLLGIPVLAGSASYAVTETLKLRGSLEMKWNRAKVFYLVIALATGIGLLLNFIGINPMKMLLYTAVLNGIVAVPLLAVILHIANNRRVMGEHVNGYWSNILGGIALLLMAGAAIALGLSFTW